MKTSLASLAVASWCGLATAKQSTKTLSPTPPMGFNDWSQYFGALNQSLFVETAKVMKEKGFLAAGYNRLNLDDEWSTMERLPNGSMTWDPKKFPKGLPWLTAHLKKEGFIPGIYTDAGTLSCGGFPGAFGHEELDAATFASWGFEYLKLDGCNMPIATEAEYKKVYGKWHDIISAMEHPLVFSESAPAYFAEAANLTDWYQVMNWVPKFGQLARHSRDTLVWNSTAYWPDITGWDSIMFNYGQEVRLARYQRPGYVNDPDFLNVDHFDYTMTERRSHFALWASLSAPLILSTNMLNITDEEVDYLTNKDIIAIDQDPLVQQATLVTQSKEWDVLTKSLHNGDRLVTVLNKGNKTASLVVPWTHIGLPIDLRHEHSSLKAKNLWTGSTSNIDLRKAKGISAKGIPSHGTALFRLSSPGQYGGMSITPTGQIFNTYSLNCLTAKGSKQISWTTCEGTDSQVWRARGDGSLSPLSNEDSYLAQEDGKSILVKSLGKQGYHYQDTYKWDYTYSGNLINRGSKHCLSEAASGKATVSACGVQTNEQVIALPVGVEVRDIE